MRTDEAGCVLPSDLRRYSVGEEAAVRPCPPGSRPRFSSPVASSAASVVRCVADGEWDRPDLLVAVTHLHSSRCEDIPCWRPPG